MGRALEIPLRRKCNVTNTIAICAHAGAHLSIVAQMAFVTSMSPTMDCYEKCYNLGTLWIGTRKVSTNHPQTPSTNSEVCVFTLLWICGWLRAA